MKTFVILVLLFPLSLFAAEITGEVIKVYDGDTITIWANDRGVKEKIRLANIDAPERKQFFGMESTAYLKGLLLGNEITLHFEKRDRYGRIIGKVELFGMNVNQHMVIEGMAWVYTKYNDNPKLPAIEQAAREAGRGLWKFPNPINPADWRKQH